MSNLLPPPNLGDDDKSRGTVQRTTVTFADNFDPRARDNSDSPTLGPRASINDSSRARSSASTSRRVSSGDAGTNSGSADDDDASRAARRTTGSFGPSVPTSRGAINPPFMWHPTGILYRFTILALVAFILLVGYFADETIGATTSELRTCNSATLISLLKHLKLLLAGWVFGAHLISSSGLQSSSCLGQCV